MLHTYDCGQPGRVVRTSDSGDIHVCSDNVEELLTENLRLNSRVAELTEECERLRISTHETEVTLERVPGALLHYLTGEESRRARKRARRVVRLHKGAIYVWINYWLWAKLTKQEDRAFIDRTFAEQCVVMAENVGDDKVYLRVLSGA